MIDVDALEAKKEEEEDNELGIPGIL